MNYNSDINSDSSYVVTASLHVPLVSSVAY